jgi:hypothetical protein
VEAEAISRSMTCAIMVHLLFGAARSRGDCAISIMLNDQKLGPRLGGQPDGTQEGGSEPTCSGGGSK